jgi:hypothetical protein
MGFADRLSLIVFLSGLVGGSSCFGVAGRIDGYLPRPAGTLTFSREIAPILFENCAGCHRPDCLTARLVAEVFGVIAVAGLAGRALEGALPSRASDTSIAPLTSPRGPPPPPPPPVAADPVPLEPTASFACFSNLGKYNTPARPTAKSSTAITANFIAGLVVLGGRIARRCGVGPAGAGRVTWVKPAESFGRPPAGVPTVPSVA